MGNSILIENCTIVTMDNRCSTIKDGYVLIVDERIEAVSSGKSGSLPHRPELVIDGRGKAAVLPGLINTHCHLSYSLGRGLGDDLPFAKWLPLVFKFEDSFRRRDWHTASMLTFLEMVKSGTTCFADTNMNEHISTVADVVTESGIRAILGKKIVGMSPKDEDRFPWLKKSYSDASRLTVDSAVDDWRSLNGKASGRILVRFAPKTWPSCSEENYREIAEANRESPAGKLIHHSESVDWRNFVVKNTGREPTLLLDDFGVLGSDALLENAVVLSDAETALIARTGTHFNYLPTSNMKNALGALDLRRLIAEGVQVSMGTSGGLINNVNDMFAEMKTLALQQRSVTSLPDAISPQTVLEMATIGGARALNREREIGSIEPGKIADLIVLDLDKPHLVPIHDIFSTIVYCATGADVRTTIIAGKVVMQDREALTMDQGAILSDAREAAERIANDIGIGSRRAAM